LWGLLRVKRLDKELAKAEADIKRVDAKLANEKFVANALEEIVEEEKEKREAGTTALICPSGKNLSSPGCKNIPLRV
jgi:valyl-tRNA synthetase